MVSGFGCPILPGSGVWEGWGFLVPSVIFRAGGAAFFRRFAVLGAPSFPVLQYGKGGGFRPGL